MIIVNNAFVYIHHPKTGGTFVTEMLRKVASLDNGFNIQEFSGKLKHAGINKIPEEHQHLPVVINVRNVFEHYVSRYTFRWWANPERAKNRFDLEKVLKEFPNFPELSFSEFLRLFNQWSLRRGMPEKKAKTLTKHNIGYNSWVLAQLVTRKTIKWLQSLDEMDESNLNNIFQKIRFLRTENLNAELYELLKEYKISEDKLSSILSAKPILPKKGGRGKQKETWHSYFSRDDVELAKKKDRMYFRLFPDMEPSDR